MEIKNKVLIHNRFDIEVRDAVTGELKKSITSYNIVLTQMYTRLCGGSTYFVNIHFGTGTGSLSPARTTLFTHLGTKVAVDDTLIKSIPLSTWKRKIVLNPEEFVGSTITEVGVAFGATNTNLVTHSLLKDAEGNTISILKTDVDVITIYATVFVTFDESNPNLKYIDMPSSNTLVNYLIGGGTAPTGAFSVNDIFLGEVKLGSTATVTWTNDSANKKRKTNIPRFATTVGNGQVKFLEFANVFSLKLPSSPIFSGQAYAGVGLGVGDGVKVNYEIPSANVRDSSIVVKKNGVVNTDYVVNEFNNTFRAKSNLDSLVFNNASSFKLSSNENGSLVAVGVDVSPYLLIYNINDDNSFSKFVLPLIDRPVTAVELSYDGTILFVGFGSAPNLCIYDYVGGVWVQRSHNISVSGTINFISSANNGIVLAISNGVTTYTYDLVVGSWVARSSVLNGALSNLKLSNNGLRLVVSTAVSYNVYNFNGTNWISIASGSPSYLASADLSGDGLWLNVSFGPSYGSSTTYFWNGSSFVQMGSNLTPTGSYDRGALSYNGEYLFSTSNQGGRIFFWNGSSWVSVGSFSYPYLHGFKHTIFNKGAVNKLFVFYLVSTGKYSISVYSMLKYKKVIFNTPPAISDVITADYTVDGVHKTDQYVIDTSFEILFGEVV